MKSREYWQKRVEEVLQQTDKSDLDYFYELQKVYNYYAKKIQDEVYSFYQKYADLNGMTFTEAKKRLDEQELADYQANAERYFKQAQKDKELLDILNKQYAAAKVRRLDELALELAQISGEMGTELEGSLSDYLSKVSEYAYEKLVSSNVDSRVIDEIITREWNGSNYSERIWGNVSKLDDQLKEVLIAGFIRGDAPSVVARELRKVFNVKRSQAETLVRTEGTHIITDATIKGYIKDGYKKYEFSAHLDSRTTKICKSLNGNEYNVKDYEPGTNAPPMHPNCRSAIMPTAAEINSNPYADALSNV
ncbi:minor capsid protein [Weissella confusa]|uniref:minor capsid protein n=1 Tax=Weissella confusa TaxID=1583 RepID=UPI00216400A7|nr:minor capsid protein [Weissella confusa]